MTDQRTTAAVNCDDCDLIYPRRVDPSSVIDRLPESLINRQRPESESVPPLLTSDIMENETVFGPIGDPNVTLQWELARMVVSEREELVAGWKRAIAATLGAGLLSVVAGRLATQCPHANGSDLDAVGAQYGIGRPTGFTDGCYWRLIVLTRFKPGNRVWLIQEVCALYTGQAPMCIEEPAHITLEWPAPVPTPEADNGQSFYSSAAAVPQATDTFWSHSGFFVGEQGDAPMDTDGFLAPAGRAPSDSDTFWQSGGSAPTGTGLMQALDLVRPAGCAITLVNAPPLGVAGCYGATLRGASGSAGRAYFANGQ